MLETESGDLTLADIDAAGQNQSLYLPDQSFRLRYRSSPVSSAGDSVGASSLPMKQLFAAVAAASAAVAPVGPSSPLGDGVSSGSKTERIAPMDNRQRDKGQHARQRSSDAAMPRFGKRVLAPANTTPQNANPYRSNGEAGGSFGKTDQIDRATQDGTPAECSGYEMHRGSEVGQPDELQLEASKVNGNQDQDVSVIASSLSNLIFMQQNGVNKGSSEVSSGLKPTADGMNPCRQMTQQPFGEVHMRSDVPQSSLLHPSWDSASHRQLNQQQQQQQQLISQLLLSGASHLLPSLSNDLAAAVAKVQHSAQRSLQQVPPNSKLTQDWWLSEELVNGGNVLSLHQNQQSTQFDATKFSVINQDFLDILRAPEHLKQESSLLSGLSLDQIVPNLMSPMQSSGIHLDLQVDHFSRKVFIGGLPPDIAEEEITRSFRQFGPLVVDWPHKAESKSYFPPKGYCFLLFQDEMSVQALINSCVKDDGRLYWSVSSPTVKDKPVQIRPWNLADSDFVMDGTQPLDPRKTIFVGGVPRPLRAVELAVVMNRLYGGVCYAGIDTDPELKYPKGAGRVAFSNQQSYIAAISARFVQLQHADIDKRVEVKPYVLDDQLCDECQGIRSGGQFAPYFCANVACLQYYCEHCWSQIHARPGREFHKPLVKEGADRPRSLPFRWC